MANPSLSELLLRGAARLMGGLRLPSPAEPQGQYLPHKYSAYQNFWVGGFRCVFPPPPWRGGGGVTPHTQRRGVEFHMPGRSCTGRMGWMAHRKRKEIKQQPGTAGPGHMLGSCLLSFHFLWAIHPIRPDKATWFQRIRSLANHQS